MKRPLIVIFFNDYGEILHSMEKIVNYFIESYVEPLFSHVYPKLKHQIFNSQELRRWLRLQFSNYNHIQEEIVAQ